MASDEAMAKYVYMSDGKNVRTAVISSEADLACHLPDFISGACKKGMLVGFDTEWMYRAETVSKSPRCAQIALLKLRNNNQFCLLIKLNCFTSMPRALVELLALKDIKFVGINICKELDKLKEDYGLEIRNAIELSSIATGQWALYKSDKWLIPLGGLDLLSESFGGLKKPQEIQGVLIPWMFRNHKESSWGDFTGHRHHQQLVYATFSAYAAVKIADNLFNSN